MRYLLSIFILAFIFLIALKAIRFLFVFGGFILLAGLIYYGLKKLTNKTNHETVEKTRIKIEDEK